MDTFAALVLHNLFGRFPNVRCLSVENGSLWVPYLLKVMDKMNGMGRNGPWLGGRITERPSDIFRRHVFVSPYHEEDIVALDARPSASGRCCSDPTTRIPEGLAEPADFAEAVARARARRRAAHHARQPRRPPPHPSPHSRVLTLSSGGRTFCSEPGEGFGEEGSGGGIGGRLLSQGAGRLRPMNVERILGEIAAAQLGLVTVAQIEKAKVSTSKLRRRVEARSLVRVQPRVYAVAGAPDTWNRRVLAALLSAGPDAIVSHSSAAALWGFHNSPRELVEITVPCSRRPRLKGVRVHFATVPPEDVREREWLRVVSIARTLVDISAFWSVGQIARARSTRRCGSSRRHSGPSSNASAGSSRVPTAGAR